MCRALTAARARHNDEVDLIAGGCSRRHVAEKLHLPCAWSPRLCRRLFVCLSSTLAATRRMNACLPVLCRSFWTGVVVQSDTGAGRSLAWRTETATTMGRMCRARDSWSATQADGACRPGRVVFADTQYTPCCETTELLWSGTTRSGHSSAPYQQTTQQPPYLVAMATGGWIANNGVRRIPADMRATAPWQPPSPWPRFLKSVSGGAAE